MAEKKCLIIDEPRDDFDLLCCAAAERALDGRRISNQQDSAVATASPPGTKPAGRRIAPPAGRDSRAHC
jgi:hypothetical protein